MSDVIQAFKFCGIDKYLVDALVKTHIYFASPTQLNDPFDCRVNIARSLTRAIDKASGESKSKLSGILVLLDRFATKFQEDVAGLGVFSFSSEMMNTVMWSHYADGHRGVCLYYELPTKVLDYGVNGVVGVSPVEYANDALTEWFLSDAIDLADAGFKELQIELMKKVLTIKSEDWKYENESRLLSSAVGAIDIAPAYLKQICFGLAASPSDIDLVSRLVQTHYSDVRLVKVESDGSDFGIIANGI